MLEEALIHGSVVAIGGIGVLLMGEPGAGKSDLALRLIDHLGSGISGQTRGAELVADDQVLVRKGALHLMASAPAALFGKLEIRGLGIVAVPALFSAPLRLAVRLTPAADIERMPDLAASVMDILSHSLPLILIDPQSASAPARIRAALDHLVAS